MLLSIVIVNFNTIQLTIDCINSIQSYLKGIKYEIILVDNYPKGGSNKYLFLQTFPDIIYLSTEVNIGFGNANNIGLKKAKGRYFLLLNSDTLLFDDSLKKSLQFMEKPESAKIGLLGCKLLNEDKSYQPSFYPFVKNSLLNYLRTNNLLFYKLFRVGGFYKEDNEIRIVGDVSGAFMLLRREVVDKVGSFDPDFFLYCEETEWCRERISKNFNIVYFPMTSIIHLGGKSAPKESMFIQSKLSLSLLWFKKGLLFYFGYILITVINIFTNILLYPFVRRETKNIIRKEISSFIILIPYLLFNIPFFKKINGIRTKPLIYSGARKIFFRTTNDNK